jgi:hypothetical protein
MLKMVTGVLAGPRVADPTKAVIDVATPTTVRDPLGISVTYTPG